MTLCGPPSSVEPVDQLIDGSYNSVLLGIETSENHQHDRDSSSEEDEANFMSVSHKTDVYRLLASWAKGLQLQLLSLL